MKNLIKNSISNTLIFLLFIIILIAIFGSIFTINSINKYVGNDAAIINKLGQIRGSIQRMSKFMIFEKNYSFLEGGIEDLFKEIDKKYLPQKFIKQYQKKVNFLTNYSELKNCWMELKRDSNLENVFSTSEKCWDIANNTTLSAQKIAEMKKNALISALILIMTIIIFFIGSAILITYFLIKKGLEKERITDKLTTLFNRYFLEEQLERQIELYNKYNQYFSVIFIDIDFFKKINDTFGHAKGDEILYEIANIIKQEIRKDDLAFRYGGEEFVIILPNTNLKEAIEIAEKIRKKIENHKFSIDRKITISIGVAEYKNESIKEFIRKVDNYLYKAKKEGRNRVIWK